MPTSSSHPQRLCASAVNLVRRGSLLTLGLIMTASVLGADTVYQAREQQERQHAQRLEELAKWCDQQGLTTLASRTRDWLPHDRDQRFLLFDPTQPAEKPQAGESASMKMWHEKFRELRTAQGNALFDLARQAAAARQVSLAMELIGGTLRENPDHEGARRALGYQRQENQWHTVFTKAKAKAGHVWHDRFGWLPQSHVTRYEAGERFNKGRWISAEHDARLHAQIDTGWELDTEHFTVTTNHSLEAAARFGLKLEQLYAAWLQACSAYTLTAADVLEPRPPRATRRHQVLVFRNRGEYQQALRGEIPDDVMTTGIYVPRRRTAYFFVPDQVKDAAKPVFDDTVLYHEAVHQLFAESRAVAPEPARNQNVWLVEGIACYFESLSERDGYLTVGGTQAERFRAAAFRLLNDRFYVPLAELSALGKDALQRDPRIARLYTQSTGLTHFLMHSKGGQRRDALLATLTAIYTGRDRPATLPEALGEGFPELDERYRQFMQAVGR